MSRREAGPRAHDVDDHALPLVVGAHKRAPGDGGDQLVYDADGSLTIVTRASLGDVDVGAHRPTVLRLHGALWRVVDVVRVERVLHYRFIPYVEGTFERAGVVVDYNPDRVKDARVESVSTVVAFFAVLAVLPLLPFYGLLPEAWRERLTHYGVHLPGAHTSSLLIEYALALAFGLGVSVSFFAQAYWTAALCLVIGSVLVVDVVHRGVLRSGGREVGMLASAVDLVRTLRAPPPGSDAPGAQPNAQPAAQPDAQPDAPPSPRLEQHFRAAGRLQSSGRRQ